MKLFFKNILSLLGLFYLIDLIRKIRFFHYRHHFPYLKIGFIKGRVRKVNRPEIDQNLLVSLVDSINKDLDYSATSQWSEIFDSYQSEAVSSLRNKDTKKLLKLLRNPLKNNLQYGFDNLSKVLQSPFRIETLYEVKSTADHFVALAEFLNFQKYISPEGLVSPIKKKLDVNALVKEIVQKYFPDNFTFPNPYLGEKGIFTPYGIASLRVPAAIYQAIQVRKFGDNICEIGPGLGRTAYFAKLLGAKIYTLVDLPISSLSQGYFLGSSLPNEAFCFNGQNIKINDGFKFHQPKNFIKCRDKYDVVLNVDSLTEIGFDTARDYLKNLIGKSEFFFSINHEGNEFCIKDIISEFPNYKLISKCRSWVRQGYVEELYKISTEKK